MASCRSVGALLLEEAVDKARLYLNLEMDSETMTTFNWTVSDELYTSSLCSGCRAPPVEREARTLYPVRIQSAPI